MDFTEIARAIAAASGLVADAPSAQPLGGGSINAAFRLCASGGDLFVKINRASRYDMFAAEAEGLDELAAAGALRVPAVRALGTAGEHAFLALEYLRLGPGDAASAAELGARLAHVHAMRADGFGWHRDNTIGTTPQLNARSENWPQFFVRRRLEYQLALARDNGAARLADAGMALCERSASLFAGAQYAPCLVHGDLWGGNWAVAAGEPVVFDPAVYYGDPETDIAMTELFGGFPSTFYSAYRERIPEQPGAGGRRELYRLYHVLNHYNLFGGAYAAQAERIIARLMRRV